MRVPVPNHAESQLVIEAPGEGEGWWAGGPSAVLDGSTWWLAYRLRRPVGQGRGYANVVARSDDAIHFQTVCTLERDAFFQRQVYRLTLEARDDDGVIEYESCLDAHQISEASNEQQRGDDQCE